jgi:hypothetical protein
MSKGLESLLETLRKRERGSKLGLERLKAAFLAKDIRESVESLCRQCQILNTMISVDGTALGVSTYRGVREARKEQQEWRQAEAKLSFAILDGQSNEHEETQKRQDERKMILEWLNPMDYASQQSDFIARRQEGTGEWLLESSNFQDWLRNSGQTLLCPGMPGAGKTVLKSIVVDYLCDNFQDNTTVGIAYLYCNFR